MPAAITVDGLRKSYGDKRALDGVTFEVPAGVCFGLLGPNGAGKSTTMKILCGLVRPDGGSVRLLGQDALVAQADLRARLGYVPQAVTLYEKLTAQENLVLFGELYGLRGRALQERIEDVLAQVGLADRARDKVITYSGGMKRRLNIAAALLHDPVVLIMDEPTVGIDPQSRNHIFSLVREMTRRGVTVVYCTHYMEEVEALCSHVAIVDHGKVIARGTLDEVLRQYADPAVYLELDTPGGEGADAPGGPDNLTEPRNVAEPYHAAGPNGREPASGYAGAAPAVPGVSPVAYGKGWMYPAEETGGVAVMETLARACRERGLKVRRLELVRPSLESVFLKLTGTSLRDE